MHDLIDLSNSSIADGRLVNTSLLTALGWNDIRAAVSIAERLDQDLILRLQQAYQAYYRSFTSQAGQRLQVALESVLEKLQKDLATAEQLQQEASGRLTQQSRDSESFLPVWSSWLKQQAQAFFNSDEASVIKRYIDIAERLKNSVATLSQFRQKLIKEIKSQSSVLSSPMTRRSLGAEPETTAQFFYPNGIGDLSTLPASSLGFVLHGEAVSDRNGYSVSSGGDINGDGFDDLLIGAYAASPGNRDYAGKSYVVFGSNQSNAWGSGVLDLSSLMDGQRGFVLQGESINDLSGYSVSSGGDINGDGFAEVLVGAYYASPENRTQAGKSYVVFGSNQSNAWGSGVLDLSSLMDGQRGFVLQGEVAYDWSGNSVSSGGDINGDGFAELLVGAPEKGINAGKSYVVFGSNQSNAWGSGVLNLSSLMNGQRGFVLQGEKAADYTGSFVSSAGDINGDGFADLLVGAPHADPENRTSAGKSYVVFGSNQSNAWSPGILNISSLMDGQLGFVLQGEEAFDQSGASVSSAGDINGDGFAELLVGAPYADPAGRVSAGKSYVIFGSNQSNAWGSGVLNLSSLMDGHQGFVLQGEYGYGGNSVSGGGDINGDGFADLLVGAYNAGPPGRPRAGKSYIILGANQSNVWGSGILDLSSMQDGQRGFALQGEAANDGSGYSLSAGDFNGDGFDDVLIGVYDSTRNNAGKSYVFWGASNSLLHFTANNLALAIGETVRLNESMLALASDRINTALLPLRVESLKHGRFSAVNALLSLSSFYPQNISSGAILFTQDGTIEAPAYRIVTIVKAVSFFSNASINFLGYPPTLLNNQLFVDQGLATTLQSADLSAEDRDDPLGDLIFHLGNIQGGQFNQYNASGQLMMANISQFNQQAIFDRQIQFIHDGSVVTPAYEVALADSRSILSGRAVEMTFNHEPVLNLSIMVLDQGQATTLRSQDISAKDLETFNEDLIIDIANVSRGYFAYASNPEFSITVFRQFSLLSGAIIFVQDGSNLNASFLLRTFDGRIYSLWQQALSYLNHRPILQGNLSDISVEQGSVFRFDLNPALFVDPDGDPLVYSVQLQGGAPLPKGIEFNPFLKRFQGRLSTLSNLQIEVQVRDPRGLIASTNFLLGSHAQTGLTLQQIYSIVSPIGSVVLALAGYIWLRRRVAAHRAEFRFANTLREAANLEYHDFMRFDGGVYKIKMEIFLVTLDCIAVGFYNGLSLDEQKSFAVCVAQILKQKGLLFPSSYGSGIYGSLFALSVGWSQKLDFQGFVSQSTSIGQEAVVAWRAEEFPCARWPYFSPTMKDKAKACCGARPSRAGMFASDQAGSEAKENGIQLEELNCRLD